MKRELFAVITLACTVGLSVLMTERVVWAMTHDGVARIRVESVFGWPEAVMDVALIGGTGLMAAIVLVNLIRGSWRLNA